MEGRLVAVLPSSHPSPIARTLISGGMGDSAYRHATAQGLEVILPADEKIMDAMKAYQAGTLVSDMRRVHTR